MRHILQLTARPGSGALRQLLVDAVVRCAGEPDVGGQVVGQRWLVPAECWEMTLDFDRSDAGPARLAAAAGRAVGDAAIDVNVLPDQGPHRRRRLLVADMESTIIEQEMLDELADYVGLRERISDITERAMRGELDFEAALKERVGLLEGLDAKVLDEVWGRVTLMPGARTLVATMKAGGAYCALVSGGFTVFTGRVAAMLGFDEHQANVLEVAGGKLTGRVAEPILGREAKLAALGRLRARLQLSPAQTMAVGDGANDLAMLGAAGIGVAFHAKPKVREAAAAMPNGAVVTHGDLTGLLYLQGIDRQQLVS